MLVHTGSRGLGYQVCDDFLHEMVRAVKRHGIELPDRQLCCVPLRSREGKRYLAAMAAAANFAFALEARSDRKFLRERNFVDGFVVVETDEVVAGGELEFRVGEPAGPARARLGAVDLKRRDLQFAVLLEREGDGFVRA